MRFYQPLLIVFVSLLQLVSSCSHRAPSIPLDLQWGSNQKQNDTLIIFLPGVRDNKQDFVDKGLFSRLQQSGIKVDMVATDVHLAYLENNTSVQRLHEDIIIPAQSNGYKKIWLVGISLGGLNALLYLKHRPEDICGLVLLSPYLGDKNISDQIIQGGGIANWQPAKVNDLNDEEALWLWLKKTNLSNVYLGTGSEDRFYPLHQQLAKLLPAKNMQIINGAHHWPVWQELWKNLVTTMQAENGFEQCIDLKHPL